MNKLICLTLLVILLVANLEGKKTARSRSSSSSRGSSRKASASSQPSPASSSSSQQSSLSGWQQNPKPASSHSYPSSQTGLSGNNNAAKPAYSYPQNAGANKESHSYPSSGGLSGQSAGYPKQQGTGLSGNDKGGGYPQQSGGLSGAGSGNPQGHSGGQLSGGSGYPHQQSGTGYSGNAAGYPHQQGSSNTGIAPPPYSGNPSYGGRPNSGGNYPNNNHHQSHGPPPPPYSPSGPGSYHNGYGSQSPGYFGNYASQGRGSGGYGGLSRPSNTLRNVGIAGAGVGTILTGLALWNLARSTGHRQNTVIYDNRGQPIAVAPANSTEPIDDPILKDLINCTLTIDNGNATEILAIPCAIATSFSPNADLNDPGMNNNSADNTKCTVTVLTKEGKEFMTTIPCSTLLNSAAENNVKEPPVESHSTDDPMTDPIIPINDDLELNKPTDLPVSRSTDVSKELNCTQEPGDLRDPINPCFAVTSNLTVYPLHNETSSESFTTPVAA